MNQALGEAKMPAWFIGAKTREQIYEAEDVMKKVPAECDDFGKDAYIAFLKSEGRWSDACCEAQKSEGIWFDGGGAIGVQEATVTWDANGCPMKTYVRQLPFLLDTMRHLKVKDEKLPGCVGLGGWMRIYIFSQATRDAAIVALEKLVKEHEAERQRAEAEMQDVMNQAIHGASVRKCGCMSGLMYVECCGKGIESDGHRELRRGISGAPKN